MRRCSSPFLYHSLHSLLGRRLDKVSAKSVRNVRIMRSVRSVRSIRSVKIRCCELCNYTGVKLTNRPVIIKLHSKFKGAFGNVFKGEIKKPDSKYESIAIKTIKSMLL